MSLEFGKGLIDSVAMARNGALSHLEEFTDRLSHYYSSVILLMFAGVTMANVYFLRPISCTLPTAPPNKFNEFAEAVCWVKGTMPLRSTDLMPMDEIGWEKLRKNADISFYQWVPFCLSVQAMMFFVPHVIWQSLARYTMGENLECILDKARQANLTENLQKHKDYIRAAAYQLFRLSRQHQDYRGNCWAQWQKRMLRLVPGATLCVIGKRVGNRITGAYIAIKILYLLNSLGQLYIIRTFLGYQGGLYAFGDKLFGTLTSKREWEESEFFPRQTYCPVSVRQLGSKSNVYTAICALPVNMFNEKIYIFIWFWIAMVTVFTAISLIVWLIRAFFHCCQLNFVRDFLFISLQSQVGTLNTKHSTTCTACHVQPHDLMVNRFIDNCVRNDGIFLLRMIRSNAGDVVTGEILNNWWHLFVTHNVKQTTNNESELNDKLLNMSVQSKRQSALTTLI